MPKQYGTHQGKWISLPLCVGGNYINYRKSIVKEAGFDEFPTTTDDFMKLAKELKKMGKPGGFALPEGTRTGSPAELAEPLLQAKALGVSHMGVRFRSRSLDEHVAQIEAFAREVVPQTK